MNTRPAPTAQPLTIGANVTLGRATYTVQAVHPDRLYLLGARGGQVLALRPEGHRPTRALQRWSPRTLNYSDVRAAGNAVFIAWDATHVVEVGQAAWTWTQQRAFDEAVSDGMPITDALWLVALATGTQAA